MVRVVFLAMRENVVSKGGRWYPKLPGGILAVSVGDASGYRTWAARCASYVTLCVVRFVALERGDRELSIRAKIVENGAIELGIWAL